MRKFLILFAGVGLMFGCASDTAPTCGERNDYNCSDFANGGADAPLYNERTAAFMTAGNQYGGIDSARPMDQNEIDAAAKKWSTTRKDEHWQEYKGAMVRVQVLLNGNETREMRLKYMQNANGGDIDSDMRTALSHVADFEMKKVCGKNVESIMVISDRTAIESVRPTAYFDYKVDDGAENMREYAFRCVYGNK